MLLPGRVGSQNLDPRATLVCLPLSPQKGDHPPSHDDNFARTYQSVDDCHRSLLLPRLKQLVTLRREGYIRICLLLDGLA